MVASGGSGGARQTALITGASSGIGLELARVLAEAGYNVVLVARGKERLVPLASELGTTHGVAAWVVPADLARPDAPAAVFAEVERLGVIVDVLINNAGFGTHGPFAATDLTAELEMLQVNVVAVTHLTKLFLPGMLARGRGKIVNVASTAAFQPGPFMAVYYATKAYVLSFTEALASELEGTGITATAICPGPTLSGFQARADIADTRLLKTPWVMDSATVARIAYRGLMAGKRIVIPGLMNRALATAVRFVPRGLTLQVTRRLNQPAGPRPAP
jgi:uncharacterized protein